MMLKLVVVVLFEVLSRTCFEGLIQVSQYQGWDINVLPFGMFCCVVGY